MQLRGRHLYGALLIAALAVLQLGAELLQVRSGFRPFRHAPARVPYSWDMFAIRIERCVVTWDPPLDVDGERVSRWHDRLPGLEFDSVFNDSDNYAAAAEHGCSYRTARRTVATLSCFGGDSGAHETSFDCP
jgi:hypothetical protein